MKSNKTSILATGAVLLLTAGLLSGCAGKSEDSEKESKEVAGAPMLSEETSSIGTDDFEGSEGMEPIDSIEDILDGIAETTDEKIDMETGEISGTADENKGVAQDLTDETQGTPLAAIDEAPTSALVDDAAEVVVMTAEITRGVQQALVDAGFKPGPVDGFSGPRTVAAIESFQAKNNLAVGPVTKGTLRALGVDFE
ncbi:MAG: peptidoglycan-binding domain-containing protein [Coxiellaceae bacterium]|nr:peptidoglycan-binding domain-containing protein [Coxiellaceae bacterium]MDP1950531.1 peptidoglycan-binding domain-containing protein [Nitrosomonas sp.]